MEREYKFIRRPSIVKRVSVGRRTIGEGVSFFLEAAVSDVKVAL